MSWHHDRAQVLVENTCQREGKICFVFLMLHKELVDGVCRYWVRCVEAACRKGVLDERFVAVD